MKQRQVLTDSHRCVSAQGIIPPFSARKIQLPSSISCLFPVHSQPWIHIQHLLCIEHILRNVLLIKAYKNHSRHFLQRKLRHTVIKSPLSKKDPASLLQKKSNMFHRFPDFIYVCPISPANIFKGISILHIILKRWKT